MPGGCVGDTGVPGLGQKLDYVSVGVMDFNDRVREHERRCEPYLLKLRMLAGSRDAALPAQVAAEVRDATSAVIAEGAAAARRVAHAAASDGRRATEAQMFLSVRLARLARSADEAVGAARSGDTSALCRHLGRFNALAAAIWTVQQAVHVPAPGSVRG
jgi:hypothetical protein